MIYKLFVIRNKDYTSLSLLLAGSPGEDVGAQLHFWPENFQTLQPDDVSAEPSEIWQQRRLKCM
jgi:hypothetical protein